MTHLTKFAQQVSELESQIEPLLQGRDPAVQSAVLADLLAIWVSGHQDKDKRDAVLKSHIDLVKRLIPVYDMPAYRRRH